MFLEGQLRRLIKDCEGRHAGWLSRPLLDAHASQAQVVCLRLALSQDIDMLYALRHTRLLCYGRRSSVVVDLCVEVECDVCWCLLARVASRLNYDSALVAEVFRP